ncbi:MobH family relaxase [Methylomonas sp. AM2-LC]|uniref:MobH family relaxase n=1 Tax=Methylomonas sp. AM2-LC TaxID=3153301 RepID=UPI003264D271
MKFLDLQSLFPFLERKRKGGIQITPVFNDGNNEGIKSINKSGYLGRLPAFPEGIKGDDSSNLIKSSAEMIHVIKHARGFNGESNREKFETLVMSPIIHLANMVHYLPASEKEHFVEIGGLFKMSLEMGLISIRTAESRILTRSDMEVRRENAFLWVHACFLNGLFNEAVKTLSRIDIHDTKKDQALWTPGKLPLSEWIVKNEVSEYQIKWNKDVDRPFMHRYAVMAIDDHQMRILNHGERSILQTLLMSLHEECQREYENEDESGRFGANPLTKINSKIKIKVIERDINTRGDNYGLPVAGMHLEPWIIDAMKELLKKLVWKTNEENGRVWHGPDGIFIIWPQGGDDLKKQLKDSECPYVPQNMEGLADLLLNAEIISPNRENGSMFEIEIPVFGSQEKELRDAIKMARFETLYGKIDEKDLLVTSYPLIVRSGVFDDSPADQVNKSEKIQNTLIDAGNQQQDNTYEEYQHNEDISLDGLMGRIVENVDSTPKSILINTNKETEIKAIISESTDLVNSKDIGNQRVSYDDEIFKEADNLYTTYPDDYEDIVESCNGNNQINKHINQESIRKFTTESYTEINEIQVKENSNNNVVELITEVDNTYHNDENFIEPKTIILFDNVTGEIFSEYHNETNVTELNEIPENAINVNTDICGLFGGVSEKSKGRKVVNNLKITPHVNSNNSEDRARLIVKRLQKITDGSWIYLGNNRTKVFTEVFKRYKLELNDCVKALRSADLLEMINGLDTAFEDNGRPDSRYIILKIDIKNYK